MPPLLNVLILYEDYGTGLRAKRSLDLLPDQLRANARLSTRLWRTQLLANPLLSEQAAREGAAADVIILSLHGQASLPSEVQTWLGSWLRHKQQRPYALGVLLDAEAVNHGNDHPILHYLQPVAASARVDLFHGFSETPIAELDVAMDEINRRARQSSTLLDDMLRRTEPRSCWGLNE